MSSVEEQPLDIEKLHEFVFRAVDEVGATLNTALVVMGDRLGLYRALAGAGPLTPSELAQRTGTAERYVREWLNAQAAGGYVHYDADGGRYSLPAEHAVALCDESSPAYLPGFFQIALGSVIDSPRITDAATDRRRDRLGRPRPRRARGVRAVLPPELQRAPAVRVAARARRRRREARARRDGRGRGLRPRRLDDPHGAVVPGTSRFRRLRLPRRVDRDRAERARTAGVDGRVEFLAAPAAAYPGTGYDLVTMFDCLHDMGDPAGAARHVRSSLAPDGAWMIVEPRAGDSVEENLNPVGRAYYGFSTLLCTPSSLAQEVGLALGAQAGEARIREIVLGAGFTRFGRVAETPFNMVFEARP